MATKNQELRARLAGTSVTEIRKSQRHLYEYTSPDGSTYRHWECGLREDVPGYRKRIA